MLALPVARRRPSRPGVHLAVAALALHAFASCSGQEDVRAIQIESVSPRCAHAGDTLTLTLSGADPALCAAARVLVGERELVYLGQTRGAPLTLEARVPPGFEPAAGAELRVTCGQGSSPGRWSLVGCGDVDAGDARVRSPDAAELCGSPIAAKIEAVDAFARPFPRDVEGQFLVPGATTDFSLATEGSRNVSPANVSYTFSSDCYPTITVGAPVLGGLSAVDLELDQLCDFAVDIHDDDCPGQPRIGHAAATFRVVK
jgi:hypothetical protein